MVAAGLERHVNRGSGGCAACGAQRRDLRVRLAGALVPALADDAAALRDDTADAWVRVGRLEPAGGEGQRALHGEAVEIREHGCYQTLFGS